MRRASKVRLYPEPTDMRKSFDGLAALVRDHLGLDPSCGDQFLFANRRRTRLKLLYGDGSGLIVLSTRPDGGDGDCAIHSPSIEVTMADLSGIELRRHGRRKDRGRAA